MKEVDVAREIKVKIMCGPNLNLRPDLFIDLSTFKPCRITLIQHITRVIFKYISGARPLDHFPEIPFPRDHSVMSQNLWFEGFFIPKALVGILEEDGNDEEITDEIHSVEDYDEDENE